jgi:hypothetical protein
VPLIERVVVPESRRANRQCDVEALADFEPGECSRRHADDLKSAVADHDRRPDDAFGASELVAPIRVADHDAARRAAAAIVRRFEQASAQRAHAEHREELAAHPDASPEPDVVAATDGQPGEAPREHA